MNIEHNNDCSVLTKSKINAVKQPTHNKYNQEIVVPVKQKYKCIKLNSLKKSARATWPTLHN